MTHVPPALPNFQVIARSHADLSRELTLCENLPTLQDGNVILQEIRAMRAEMGHMRVEMGHMRVEMGHMRVEMGHMRAEMGQLKTLVTASNDNTLARLHNSQIIRPDQHLIPLSSTITNEPILFPETVNDLQRLPNAVTIDILRALSAPIDGNATVNKSHLRLQCGLKQKPI